MEHNIGEYIANIENRNAIVEFKKLINWLLYYNSNLGAYNIITVYGDAQSTWNKLMRKTDNNQFNGLCFVNFPCWYMEYLE